MTGRSKAKPAQLSFKDIRAAARPAERTVPICFRPDLRGRMQEIERQLQIAERARVAADALDAGGPSGELAEQLEKVRGEMQQNTVVFHVRRMPRDKFRDLKLDHPPAEGVVAEVDLDTFLPALIRACVVEPVLDDDDWEWLFGPEQLSDAEYDALSNAAWAVNARDVLVPFSGTASRVLHSGEPGSRRLNGSA